MSKTTILFHSRTGMSALIAGLSISDGGFRLIEGSLPRLWRKLNEPGQYLAFECADRKVICFNSGEAGTFVEHLVFTSATLWNGQHIVSRLVPEGVLSKARGRLFCFAPNFLWLIAPEIGWGKDMNEWK